MIQVVLLWFPVLFWSFAPMWHVFTFHFRVSDLLPSFCVHLCLVCISPCACVCARVFQCLLVSPCCMFLFFCVPCVFFMCALCYTLLFVVHCLAFVLIILVFTGLCLKLAFFCSSTCLPSESVSAFGSSLYFRKTSYLIIACRWTGFTSDMVTEPSVTLIQMDSWQNILLSWEANPHLRTLT